MMAPIILIKNAFQIHQRYPLLDNMKKIIVLVLLVGLSLESLAQDSIEQALTHESEVLSEIINHYSLSSAINDTSYIGFLYGVTWTMVVPDSNHQYSAYWGRTLDKDQYYQIRYLEDPAYTEMLQSNVDEQYYITSDKMAKWAYLKGAKKIPRKSANGHEYVFSEGPIAFPDPWDRPGRTMLTSESTLNRSTHVVSDPGTGRLRLITPIEAERLQGFDDDWTNSGMPNRMRYFCMGNALVVPMITRMGKVLDSIIEEE